MNGCYSGPGQNAFCRSHMRDRNICDARRENKYGVAVGDSVKVRPFSPEFTAQVEKLSVAPDANGLIYVRVAISEYEYRRIEETRNATA